MCIYIYIYDTFLCRRRRLRLEEGGKRGSVGRPPFVRVLLGLSGVGPELPSMRTPNSHVVVVTVAIAVCVNWLIVVSFMVMCLCLFMCFGHPIRKTKIWKLGGSTRGDSYLKGVSLPPREGESPNLSTRDS